MRKILGQKYIYKKKQPELVQCIGRDSYGTWRLKSGQWSKNSLGRKEFCVAELTLTWGRNWKKYFTYSVLF